MILKNWYFAWKIEWKKCLTLTKNVAPKLALNEEMNNIIKY